MSWPTWPTAAPPLPTPAAQPTLLPTPVNSAPSVLPPGLQYSPEQWAQAQQQNWQQWAQWQQQYQQWHQQYGAEYQKSLTAMQTTVPATQPPLPATANVAVAPPLPENRPPLPPEEPPINPSYASLQTKQMGYNTAPLTTAQPPPSTRGAWPQKRSFGQESESSQGKKPLLDQWGPQKETPPVQTNYSHPPPQTTTKANVEELSEAEKKFDKEFAAWEAQFQKWKEQNANHPDKTQYREYEKKWESWRNSLLERREQMRKKRLALTGGVGAIGGSKPPNFTQPPPNINQLGTNSNQQSVTNQTSYGGLNPNENNEALSFKKQTDSMTSENSFLKTTSSSTGIPGLDLVKGNESEFDTDNKDLPNKGPDLEAISKGINNILGDQKLLNMLSMVTKHPPPAPGQQKFDFSSQPPAINYQETQYGNMTNPPPPVAAHRDNFNDQSNQSFEEKSNYVDYHQREAVTNFDDQTRSSFTMGINDSDQNFKGRGRFGDERLGGNFGSSFPRSNVTDTVPKSLLSLSFPPGGPKMMKDDYSGPKNILPEPHAMGRNNFGQMKNDNFKQRTQDNSNRFPPKKDFYSGAYERENFQDGNGRHQYNRHLETDSKNFSGEYNQDYDNYGDEDDYDKYHDIFNEGDQDYNDDDNYRHNNRDDFTNKNQYQQQFSNENMPEEIVNRDTVVPPQPEPIPPEEPIFQPSKVIDYEHKSLNQSDIEVAVEPIHMFDYRHKPVNRIPLPQRPKWLSESVKFIREFDPLASRIYERPMLDRMDRPPPMDKGRFDRERNYHEFEREREYDRGRRSYERDSGRGEDHRGQLEREGFTYRNEKPNNYDERDRKRIKLDRENRKDNKDHSDDNLNQRNEKSKVKEDFEELSDEDMDWEAGEKNKPTNQGDVEANRSRSTSPILSNPPNPTNVINEIQTIEDIINPPGRFSRPPRIVIILRGPPGSGKTYLARLIKDKEVDNGGSAPRILSLDDYFMVEHEKSVVEDGKNITVKEMVYEYEAEMEESYRSSFIKSFKKTITDGYFPFIIVDNVNDKVKYFGEMWSFAKHNGFQVYICQMDLDPVLCTKRNIHNRTEAEIEEIIAEWEPTPSHHPTIDATGFLQQNQIKEVEMEIVPEKEPEEEPSKNESAEQNLTESANHSEKVAEPWKNTFKWRGSGNHRGHQNRGRRGYGGQTWRSRGNWRR